MKPHKLTFAMLSLCIVVILCHTEEKIGYFWHITDFHYDPLYTTQGDTRRNCRKTDERGNSGYYKDVGKFGDYACESPFDLIESAADFMKDKLLLQVDFVLWTGDMISRHYGDERQKFLAIKKLSDILHATFINQFVFPVIGHVDPNPSENFTSFWMDWLPVDALKTFTDGGYYTIDQTKSKLRIVAINTNLFGVREMSNVQTKRQWEWLHAVLEMATAKQEMVYILGHIAPGIDSSPEQNAYSSESNEKYLKMIQKYAKIIAGQFFGHAHADTFRVFYDNDKPVSWAFLAPSMSPHREPGGSSNPGVRFVKYNTINGKVLDYTQFYLDIVASNKAGRAEWITEYNLTQYYGLQDINSHVFHNLADKMKNGPLYDAQVVNKFNRAYSVKFDNRQICDDTCRQQHYCTITCLDFKLYKRCMEASVISMTATADLLVTKTLLTFITFILSMFM